MKIISRPVLFKYISQLCPTEIAHVNTFMQTLPEQLTQVHKDKIAILLWKCLPGKAVFAQDFSLHIIENLEIAKLTFNVPLYIKAAFTHLKQ